MKAPIPLLQAEGQEEGMPGPLGQFKAWTPGLAQGGKPC